MNNHIYKTDISGEAALQRVTPILNGVLGIGNWRLDVHTPDKELVVCASSLLQEDQAIEALHKAGFKAVDRDDYFLIY